MPKLSATSVPVDVWFEDGIVKFDDPNGTSKVIKLNVYDFEKRILALKEMLKSVDEKFNLGDPRRALACSSREYDKFLAESEDFIKGIKEHLHAGMDIDTILTHVEEHKPTKLYIPG